MTQTKRATLRNRILLGIVGVLVVALVAGYWYMRPLLMTGTGYAAHNACALHFISDRDDHETDLPPNPIVPVLRATIDEDAGTARASILGILAGQTAYYTPGFGCTIGKKSPELPAAHEVSWSNPIAEAPAPASVDPAITEALEATFANAPGTRAIVVLKDGELLAERYADGFTKDTPQLGWSMAKSVTNLLIGRIVERDGLDITAGSLRPEWEGDDRSKITLEHLLRMTPGLQWDETYDLGTPITEMLYTADDMGDFAASQPLSHGVNEYHQYSSGSTNIACDVLLDHLGADANLPRTEIFEKLGLSTAVLEPDAAGVPVCSSYMWASARDWAAVGQFALDDGVVNGKRLLPAGWIAESVVPTDVAEMEDQNYGMSWWLNARADGTLEVPDLPADTYWASGHDGQRIYVVPSEGIVMVRLGFSPDGGILTNELLTSVIAAVNN